MDPTTLFIVFFVAGVLLVGAEVFVPGGILGTAGAGMLIGSIITAYFISPTFGLLATGGGAVMCVISIILWIRLFPQTNIGKNMTLSVNGHDFKSSQDGLTELLGQEGVTQSDLRPGGFALIDGRRIDVVSEGGMIDRNTRVRVTTIEGNRVVVRALSDATT